jgi:putative membrane protein
MNVRLTLSIALASLLCLSGCSIGSSKSTAASTAAGPMRASPEAARFLSQAADMRRFDYAAGALAMTHATTPELRAYGAQMTRDQTFLLDDLTRLAASLRVPIPTDLNESAETPLQNLADLQGTDFDRRFIGMMATNHAHDLASFRQAGDFDRDPYIKAFADKHIGLIQSHFDDLKALGTGN